jgi:hypothetical protein
VAGKLNDKIETVLKTRPLGPRPQQPRQPQHADVPDIAKQILDELRVEGHRE